MPHDRSRLRAGPGASRPASVLFVCTLLAGTLLAADRADAQLVGRFREIKFQFFGGCTNDVEKTSDQTSPVASGAVIFTVACRGGSATLIVDYQAPATTPTIPALPGDFSSPVQITTTVTAIWTSPPPPFPPAPYRITVAAGTLSSCADRQERTNFPAGVHTLAATKACAFGGPSSASQPLPPGLNGGFSAGSAGESWGGASYVANVYYDFVSAAGADLAVSIAGPEQVPGYLSTQTVRVTNNGPETATGVVAFLNPDHGYFGDPPPGCAKYSYYVLKCTSGTLQPGGVSTFVVDLTSGTPDKSSVTLQAIAGGVSVDPDFTNNRATHQVAFLADCLSRETCAFANAACETTVSLTTARRLLRAASSLASVVVDLVPLYRLRDEVFSASSAGRRYTQLYYAHAAELARMLATSTAFHDQFLSAYGLWKDHARKLVEGQGGSAVISQAQVDGLLGVLASLESSGSPELRGAIAREKAALNVPSLVGKTMIQALAAQQATAPAVVTVPASASIHGLAPAFFHTDARVFNPSAASTAPVTARFRCFTGACPASSVKTFNVAPREMRVLDDVLVSLFGAPETAGPIEFEGPVLVETRTYTPSRPDPTTGSAIPGVPPDESFPETVLTSLSHSADSSRGFRTNAGVYNPNDVAVTATIRLFSAAGAVLGSVAVPLGPRAAGQVSNVFGAAGVAGDVADAYAVVKADGILPLFAYATVIDNKSQDPTFVAGRNARGAADQVLTVPAAASIHGVPPAFFHSDARVFNPSADVTVTVDARFHCFTGPCPADPARTFTVAPREMKVLDDVLVSLFGAPETAGPVEFAGAVHVDTRVYTPSRPDPTAGSGTPGVPASAAAAETFLLALSHSADSAKGFRTNVGVFNPEGGERSFTTSLFRPDGTKLGDVTSSVAGGSAVQISGVFSAAGIAGDVPDAYAVVKSADGRGLFSYATVIENRTGDSVFIVGRPGR